MPATVTNIGGSYAFLYSVNLEYVTFEENSSLKTIGAGAFYLCTSLTSIDIPMSTTQISDNAFRNCSSLRTININCVTSIGASAFSYCNKLEVINMYRIYATGMTLGAYWNDRNGAAVGGIIEVVWGCKGV